MRILGLFLFFALSLQAQKMNQVDAKGKKQGPWQKYHGKSSVLEYKGQFKDDKPVGTFYYYYSNNKIQAIVKHDENSSRSYTEMFHENGNLSARGIYKNLKKDSVWEYYMPSGRISTRETFKDNVLNGLQTIYYVPEVITDKSIKVARTANYKNGLLHGEVTDFFDSGIVRTKGNYDKGKRVGTFITNHLSGKTAGTERYIDGFQHGWQSAHDEFGKEINRVYFYHGRRLEGKELEDILKQYEKKGKSPNGYLHSKTPKKK